MSADKLPLTVENVMAEKDKVAEAAIRGESYDPFGIADSFEPAAAADAINAVLRAPSVSAPSGLEMQTEVELVDKEKVMETQQDEAERPKSPPGAGLGNGRPRAGDRHGTRRGLAEGPGGGRLGPIRLFV